MVLIVVSMVTTLTPKGNALCGLEHLLAAPHMLTYVNIVNLNTSFLNMATLLFLHSIVHTAALVKM